MCRRVVFDELGDSHRYTKASLHKLSAETEAAPPLTHVDEQNPHELTHVKAPEVELSHAEQITHSVEHVLAPMVELSHAEPIHHEVTHVQAPEVRLSHATPVSHDASQDEHARVEESLRAARESLRHEAVLDC